MNASTGSPAPSSVRPSCIPAARLLAVGLLAALLGACATPSPQSRIANNPALYEALSPEHREFVASGVIREGMTRDAVFLAWGRPGRVSEGSRGGNVFETWTYLENVPVRRHDIGIGGGWSRYGHRGRGYHRHRGWGYDPFYGGGSTVDWVPVWAAEVTFIRDRVSEWRVRR